MITIQIRTNIKDMYLSILLTTSQYITIETLSYPNHLAGAKDAIPMTTAGPVEPSFAERPRGRSKQPRKLAKNASLGLLRLTDRSLCRHATVTDCRPLGRRLGFPIGRLLHTPVSVYAQIRLPTLVPCAGCAAMWFCK